MRKNTHKKEYIKAFSTIELMTTIAIILILASVSLAGLWSVRAGSRVKSAESLLMSARTGALACVTRGETLSDRVVNEPMCGTNSVRWPKLPNGWVYDDPMVNASDITDRTFTFSASGDGKTVECTEVECSTS